MNNSIPILLRWVISLLASTETLSQSIRHGCRDFRYGLLVEALTDLERTEFSILAYHDSLPAERAQEGLHFWEEPWFERELPPPPARLLVAAAGTGREAVALQKQGYHVDVLEPALHPSEVCRQHLPPESIVVQASFGELADSVLEKKRTPAHSLATSYDSILLGWGGLTHVLQRDERLRLLKSCSELTQGPILASFFMDPGAVDRQRSIKMTALGCRVGKFIARRRGIPAEREPVEYTDWGGFLRHFKPGDIDELAAVINRSVAWQHEGGFPHVTFLKPTPQSTDDKLGSE